MIPFSTSFMRRLRELTEERGVLLVLDEIQTGIGRTGRMFCYEHLGIRPDLKHRRNSPQVERKR